MTGTTRSSCCSVVEQQRLDRDRLNGKAGEWPGGRLGELVDVGRAHVDGQLEAPRQGVDGAEVVEVAVRDEDRLRARADLVEGVGQRVGLVAGVDDERLAVGGDDEAVGAERPEGQHEDIEMVGHSAILTVRG